MQTIGNLFPLIEKITEQNNASLSFTQGNYSSIVTWRELARAKLLELLRYHPLSVPLDPDIVEVVECDGYIREKLYFSSAPGVRIPTYLLRPTHQTEPRPAIVALHDHGGFYSIGKEKLVENPNESPEVAAFKATYYSGHSYASDLARAGYIVIVIDAFYFGERRVDFDTVDPVICQRLQSRISTLTEKTTAFHEQASAFEETVARHIFAAGATWLGIMSHDDRASVDYLVSRPEVDPHRIGSVGLSMGGHRNNYLFATDPRIKAAVTVGWMSNWRDLLANHVGSHSWAQFVPGLAESLELSDVASIGAPGYLLVLQCAQDELFTGDAMHRACDKLESIFTKAELRDHFHYSFYDVPHQFNASMQKEAHSWFDRWLK